LSQPQQLQTDRYISNCAKLGKRFHLIEVAMSFQLEQVLNQVRQLSTDDQLELFRQLSVGETDVLSWTATLRQMEQQALANGQVEQTEGGSVVKAKRARSWIWI
jgi:hypothetical protein